MARPEPLFGKKTKKYFKFLKDFIFCCVLYRYSGNTEYLKGENKMSQIFKWFAEASANWDHTSQNDAGAVLGFLGAIVEALGA